MLIERIESLESDIQSLIKKQTRYFESEKLNKTKIERQLAEYKAELEDRVYSKNESPDNDIAVRELQNFKAVMRKELEVMKDSINSSSPKYNALFNEVVRIGKEQESYAQHITVLNKNLDEKIKSIDMLAKKNGSDVGSLEDLNAISTQLIDKYAEKNDQKVRELATQIQVLSVYTLI